MPSGLFSLYHCHSIRSTRSIIFGFVTPTARRLQYSASGEPCTSRCGIPRQPTISVSMPQQVKRCINVIIAQMLQSNARIGLGMNLEHQEALKTVNKCEARSPMQARLPRRFVLHPYAEKVLNQLKNKNPWEKEFIQSVVEIFRSISYAIEKNPVYYTKQKILERITEPERLVAFRVPWRDDSGQIQINTGYRVEFNSAIGAYKGGLRFHPSVSLSILKFW